MTADFRRIIHVTPAAFTAGGSQQPPSADFQISNQLWADRDAFSEAVGDGRKELS
jgi:hypothetical protein